MKNQSSHSEAVQPNESADTRPAEVTREEVTANVPPGIARQRVVVIFGDLTFNENNTLLLGIMSVLAERYDIITVAPRCGELASSVASFSSMLLRIKIPKHGTPAKSKLDRVLRAATRILASRTIRFKLNRVLKSRVLKSVLPKYAITNTIHAAGLCYTLQNAGVPLMALMNDFAFNVRPLGSAGELLRRAAGVVFPSHLVASSYDRAYFEAYGRTRLVLVPGVHMQIVAKKNPIPERPLKGPFYVDIGLPEHDFHSYFNELTPTTKLVIGIGDVTSESGIEAFIDITAKVAKEFDCGNLRFVWFGIRLQSHDPYTLFLQEKMRQQGVDHIIDFVLPPPSFEGLLARATSLVLTERFGVITQTAFEAAKSGTPVIAFASASTYAEWAGSQPQLAKLVAPYGNTAAAAELLLQLLRDDDFKNKYSQKLRSMAVQQLDFACYVRQLDTYGMELQTRISRIRNDEAVIVASGLFDPQLARHGYESSDEDVLKEYLLDSLVSLPASDPRSYVLRQRPMAGFHPLAYAESNPVYSDSDCGDPFAHYLASGRPTGRWNRRLITPSASIKPRLLQSLRIIVHGHFHYPDLVPEFLEALKANAFVPHLLITTTAPEKAEQIKSILTGSSIESYEVASLPNKGRNFGPLLTGVSATIQEYDLLLHFHGKKSLLAERTVGDKWRKATLAALIGPSNPMADIIATAFAEDTALGLVSPESAILAGWDANLPDAQNLVSRMGLPQSMPMHFDFPVGAMFWARPQALMPLFELNLTWEAYPLEPLPIDGTMLHSLERLVPFVVEAQGFEYAKAYVPGLTR